MRRETKAGIPSGCHTLGAPASPPASAGGGQENAGCAGLPARCRRRRPGERAGRQAGAFRRGAPSPEQGHRPSAGGRLSGASPQEGLKVGVPTRAWRRRWLLPPRLDGPKGRGSSGRSRSLGEGGAGARFGRLRSASASVSVTAWGVTCLKPAGPPSLRSLPRLDIVAPRDEGRHSIWLPHTGCAGVPAGCRRRRPGEPAGRQAGAFRRGAPPPEQRRRPSAGGRLPGASPQGGRTVRASARGGDGGGCCRLGWTDRREGGPAAARARLVKGVPALASVGCVSLRRRFRRRRGESLASARWPPFPSVLAEAGRRCAARR